MRHGFWKKRAIGQRRVDNLRFIPYGDAAFLVCRRHAHLQRKMVPSPHPKLAAQRLRVSGLWTTDKMHGLVAGSLLINEHNRRLVVQIRITRDAKTIVVLAAFGEEQ